MRSGEPILPEPAERDWFRTHLIGDLLPRWLWAVGSPSGIFIPHLDREWRRTREGPATLVSQARLLYNFATGFRLTGEEAYAEAVRLGADALIARFGDGPPGCWAWSVDGDGSIRDAHRSAYGYAFVVFGLAHAFAATGDARYRSAALDTARVIFARFGERDGGFIPTLRPNWSDAGATRTQNPIMHLFEALLALGHEGGAPEMLAEAAGVARFLCDRLM
ncbi:MAG: hypothetical protein FJX72_10145, partial [Armatimonadetes bacterium]|nr:hypothetical protein [Armatimonadota bacterium]